MAKRLWAIFLPVVLAVWTAGCARPPAPRDSCLHLQCDEPELVWRKAVELVKRHNFRPDLLDRRRGIITTYPEISRQVWELWRGDVVDDWQMWESSLHTIRRRLEVAVRRRDDGGVDVTVRAFVQRLSLPESQITSTGEAFAAFSPAAGLKQRTGGGSRQVRWIDLGRDARLEQEILSDLAAILW